MLEALVLMVAASTTPGTEVAPPAPAPKDIMARNVSKAIKLAATNPGRTICTRVQKTGWRLKTEKVCMTAEAWREISEQQVQLKSDVLMRGGLQG